MQDQLSHIAELYQKWINGQATEEEVSRLMKQLGDLDGEDQLVELMNKGWTGLDDIIELSDEQKAAIAARATGNRPGKVYPMRRWWAAAAVVLLLAAGAYIWTNNRSTVPSTETIADIDIQPGKEGAVLTLADGSEVVLDSMGNGVIATQNGAQVLLSDGSLAYDPAASSDGEIAFNTMTTPKGRQFQVRLPDGTQVWLNAASSIRYPTVFTGNERKVAITGEVYFEVAKNAGMPFRVNVNNKTEVEVLGTHFNVNAYDNEAAVNTTLLEGSVRMGALVLKPGQQAALKPGGQAQLVKNAGIDKVVAWKNGLFNFQDVPLEAAMRQLERWYDIEVVYEQGVPDVEMAGELTRDITLNDLLLVLGKIRIKCRLEGRKMIISR